MKKKKKISPVIESFLNPGLQNKASKTIIIMNKLMLHPANWTICSENRWLSSEHVWGSFCSKTNPALKIRVPYSVARLHPPWQASTLFFKEKKKKN